MYISFLSVYSLGYRLPRLTPNVPAALRGRGFHKGLGGRHTCKFAQMFGREYTPALAKPPVIGWRYAFSSIYCFTVHLFQFFDIYKTVLSPQQRRNQKTICPQYRQSNLWLAYIAKYHQISD